MQKHLLRYPWILAAAIAGIFAFIAFILRLFWGEPTPETLPSGAAFVKEAMHHAAL